MLPLMFYYGGQVVQSPTYITFAPVNQFGMQYFPMHSQMVMISPPSSFDQNIGSFDEKPKGFTKITNQSDLEEKTRTPKTQSDVDLKIQEKSARRIQNPYRNIYTNLTNLILNFIVCRKKMANMLQMIDPSLVGDKLEQFCKYIKSLKSYFCSYFNLQKVKKLFNGASIPNFNKEFHRVLRKAAKFILEEKIPACLLTSKKLSPLLRHEHLNARRAILTILKHSNAQNLSH